jgi:iron complex outermembrane receptor protein
MSYLIRPQARRRGGTRTSVTFCAFIVSFGCLVQAALGQQATGQKTAAADDANTINEVVVTAQYRREDLQQTPLAITAVSADMLERRNQTSVEQVAAQAPNVSLVAQGGASGPALLANIRGVGQTDFSPALEPAVGIYVDDVYYATLTTSILDLLDLDRIEILRGPQGTLAGRNTIGGAIKLYSQPPTGETSGYLEASTGSRNLLQARGTANFALVPDKLFMRISAVTDSQQGYVDRVDFACANPGSGLPTQAYGNGCLLGHEGGKKYSAGRMMLRWLASDSVEVNLNADVTQDNSEGAAVTLLYANNQSPAIRYPGVPNIPFDSRFVPSNPYTSYASFSMPNEVVNGVSKSAMTADPGTQFLGWGTSGTVDWRLNDTMALKSITAVRGYNRTWGWDADTSPLPLGLGTEHLTHHQFSQELRLSGTALDKSIDYTVGAYYGYERTLYTGHLNLLFVSPAYEYLIHDPVPAHSRAGFTNVEWHATEKLDLIGGVRYTREEKDYTYSRTNPDGTPTAMFASYNDTTGHYEGAHWDYRADLDYHWTKDLMTYVQYSTGFKGGGVNPRPFFGPGPDCPDPKKQCQVQPFGPETLDAIEVGLKSTLFDERMRLNVSAFFNKYKDLQLTILNCPQYSPPGLGSVCGVPSNAGDANIEGLEVETEVHPINNLLVDGSLSYLDFRYTRIDPNAGGPSLPGSVQFGMVPPYVSKWKGSLGIQYEVPLANAGSITPRVDANYRSQQYASATNGPTTLIDGYTLANARLTWRSPGRDLQVALAVTNFTNKLFYLTKADLVGFGGIIWAQPGEPREWSISVKKQF